MQNYKEVQRGKGEHRQRKNEYGCEAKDTECGGGLNERAKRQRGRIRSQDHVNAVTVAIKSLNWMLHMASNEIQH